MNKILLKSTVLMVATLGGTLMASAVSADTQTMTSDITFTSGGLNIVQSPKAISFGSHPITSKDQTFAEVNTAGKTSPSSITVGDYSGQTTKGWQLTAKLEDGDFGGLELSINPKGAGDYASFNNQILNSSEKSILSVTADKISKEKMETAFNLGAMIHVPANTPLSAKTYKNTIDWNLQSSPQ